MLELDLEEAIKRFVGRFYIVRRQHLDKFFSDWDHGNYVFVMNHLLTTHVLYELPGGLLSRFHPEKIHTPLPHYNGILSCLDMMTDTLTSTKVKWCDVAEFPLEMRFLTVADVMYDVTYLDEMNWQHKYTLLPIAWRKTVLPGEGDVFNHIAVVTSLDMAQRVRNLPFSQFVLIDRNGAVIDIYDNE